MENELFEIVIKEMESTGTANDRYFLTGIEVVELKTIQAIAEAYAAKREQKHHLMKMNEEREDELHPDSNNLLKHCFEELRLKMIKNQEKYGYSNEWLTHNWEQECRDNMMDHIQKGDPRDVAIYALFMMYRGWSTKSQKQTGEIPLSNIIKLIKLADHIQLMDKHMATQFQAHDYRQMWEIWRGVADMVNEIENNIKQKLNGTTNG